MEPTHRIGIAGHRSWISRALAERIGPVLEVPKAELAERDFTGLDCLYLVLGRAKPGPGDEIEEVEQLKDYLVNGRKARRTVYLSSMVQTAAKRLCEHLIAADQTINYITVLRPGAIFGPSQSPGSPMLIPSLARSDGRLELHTPRLATKFISLDDLVGFLANFANKAWWNIDRAGEPESIVDIPGTFMLMPYQVKALYLAFRGLDGAIDDMGPGR